MRTKKKSPAVGGNTRRYSRLKPRALIGARGFLVMGKDNLAAGCHQYRLSNAQDDV